MNIATLGVAIDPTKAQAGAAAATRALDSVTAAATRTSAATQSANNGVAQSSQRLGAAAKQSESDVSGSFGRMTSTVGRWVAMIAAATAVFTLFTKSISAASEMETATNQFAVLLRSVDAAKERMQELNKFAAETPFELPEIVQASRQLEIFTKGALSTGAGLTMVGDAAAVAGTRFDEMALPVGRAYAALMNGSPVGEAMESLRRFGVVSVETSNRLLDLQKSGEKGSAVWGILERELMSFSGAMKIQSQSWTGLMSTLSDSVKASFRAFGEPILDQLKPLLTGWIGGMATLEGWARSAGQATANAIATIRGLFESGTIGQAFGLALQIGAMEGTNFLTKALGAVFLTIPQLLISSAKNFVSILQVLATREFWSGMAKQLFAIAADLGTRLIDAFSTPIAIMQAKLEGIMIDLQNEWNNLFGGDQIQFDENAAIESYKSAIRAFVGINKNEIDQMYASAKTDLSGLFETFGQAYSAEVVKVVETARKMFEETGDFFDPKEVEEFNKQLDALLTKAKELGTVVPQDISALLPKAAIAGETSALESGDKFKSRMESDLEIMREFRKEAEALKALSGGKLGNATEFGRRRDALEASTVSQLQDPAAYAKELGRWRTFQAEKELAARETDQRIAAGGASSMESLQRGFERAGNSFGNMQQAIAKGAEGAAQIMSQSMGTAIGDWITGAKSAKDAFRDMLIEMLNGIAKLITQLLVELAVRSAIKAISGYATGGSVPSGGNVAGYNYNATSGYSAQGFADGGHVFGGRGGVDDIPAYLTAGEFVIPKDAADFYGRPMLEDIRRKRAQRFAEGGMVGGTETGRGGRNDGGASGIAITINVDAKSKDGGGGKDDKDKGEKLGQKLHQAVRAVIVEEQRAGGLLAGANNR